jgi:trigger factor
MSLIKKEKSKNEKNLYTLEFSVEKEVFDTAVNKVYAKEVKKINVPGFRKGKAPRNVIEKMYGKGVFYEEAINECIPEAFEAALKESKLDMVGRPEFDVVSIDDNGVVLTAKLYVKPDVKIEGYAGIEASKEVKEVSDEDIENELLRVRERNSRTVEVNDRAAEMNDVTNIDFDGYVDGVAFDGGKSEGFDLKLGSGQFIPGFEEQIVGKNIGEEFDVNVTFPEDYHAENLKGKAAVFKTKINAIKKVELPELDDEFAKDVSEFDTIAEYKADIKAKIQDRYEKQADSEFETKLIEALIEKLNADIPAAMFDAETENYVRDYDSRLRMQGLDLSTYFKYTGMNLDQLREQLRPQAEKQVKVRLALEKIAKLEGIKVYKKDVDAEYGRISEAYNVPVDQVKEMVDAKSIEEDLKVKAAMDFVKANAVIAK